MREEQDLKAQVRAFFEAHGASRFEDLSSTPERRVIDRVGYRRITPSGIKYWVMPEQFKREVCKGRDAKSAEKLLVALGWIKPGGDGRATRKTRLEGIPDPIRVYEFTSRMWDADEA